jgi:hypothetical protein
MADPDMEQPPQTVSRAQPDKTLVDAEALRVAEFESQSPPPEGTAALPVEDTAPAPAPTNVLFSDRGFRVLAIQPREQPMLSPTVLLTATSAGTLDLLSVPSLIVTVNASAAEAINESLPRLAPGDSATTSPVRGGRRTPQARAACKWDGEATPLDDAAAGDVAWEDALRDETPLWSQQLLSSSETAPCSPGVRRSALRDWRVAYLVIRYGRRMPWVACGTDRATQAAQALVDLRTPLTIDGQRRRAKAHRSVTTLDEWLVCVRSIQPQAGLSTRLAWRPWQLSSAPFGAASWRRGYRVTSSPPASASSYWRPSAPYWPLPLSPPTSGAPVSARTAQGLSYSTLSTPSLRRASRASCQPSRPRAPRSAPPAMEPPKSRKRGTGCGRRAAQSFGPRAQQPSRPCGLGLCRTPT